MASTTFHRARLVPYSGHSREIEILFHIERESSNGALRFFFEIENRSGGALEQTVLLAEDGPAQRRDELWKSTCFECFIGRKGSSSYCEVNLAVDGSWNIYVFDRYREGMKRLEGVEKPFVSFDHAGSRARLEGRLAPAGEGSAYLNSLLDGSPLELSATCVLEYVGKPERDYLALAHKGAKPDFHLRDSFILEV